MWEDPIVAEVRKARQEYAERFNNDLWAIFRDLKEQEKRSGRTYVSYRQRGQETNRPDSGPAMRDDELVSDAR